MTKEEAIHQLQELRDGDGTGLWNRQGEAIDILLGLIGDGDVQYAFEQVPKEG